MEDCHCQLDPPAPLSSSLSKQCDRQGFSQDSQHQIAKGHLRQKPFEEQENEKRNSKDERNRKWSSIEAGIDAIAIAANSFVVEQRQPARKKVVRTKTGLNFAIIFSCCQSGKAPVERGEPCKEGFHTRIQTVEK